MFLKIEVDTILDYLICNQNALTFTNLSFNYNARMIESNVLKILRIWISFGIYQNVKWSKSSF